MFEAVFLVACVARVAPPLDQLGAGDLEEQDDSPPDEAERLVIVAEDLVAPQDEKAQQHEAEVTQSVKKPVLFARQRFNPSFHLSHSDKRKNA